jgi:hypothetical protein
MFGADIELIAEDDEHMLIRVTWNAGEEHFEKWITKRKDEIEDEEEP